MSLLKVPWHFALCSMVSSLQRPCCINSTLWLKKYSGAKSKTYNLSIVIFLPSDDADKAMSWSSGEKETQDPNISNLWNPVMCFRNLALPFINLYKLTLPTLWVSFDEKLQFALKKEPYENKIHRDDKYVCSRFTETDVYLQGALSVCWRRNRQYIFTSSFDIESKPTIILK